MSTITADYQRSGRGRLGRTWTAPEGSSLLMSIILKPDIPTSDTPKISAVIAVAAVRTLARLDVEAKIKWPNDLLVGNKKVAGLLAEASIEGDRTKHVVASIGININQSQEDMAKIDRPATSIKVLTGLENAPDEVGRIFIDEFERAYDAFINDGFAAIYDEWNNNICYKGDMVLLDMGTRVIEGRIVAVNEDASLKIEDGSGNTKDFIAGEIIKIRTSNERNV